MLPFFLAAAAGNKGTAKAALLQLVSAYSASTPTELDLVGRIIGFSVASMDNLRLSMTPGLSDTKVLRYRCNAVTLSRASDQALKILEAVQTRHPQTLKTPRPTVAAAPTPTAPPPAAPTPVSPSQVSPPVAANHPVPSRNSGIPEAPLLDIEAMKRDARVLMAAFSKHGAQSSAAFPVIPDPSGAVSAAAKQAVAAARRR